MSADYTYDELEYLRTRYNDLVAELNNETNSERRRELTVDVNNAFLEWQRYNSEFEKTSGPNYVRWLLLVVAGLGGYLLFKGKNNG